MEERLLTVAEVAVRLRIDPHTVRTWLRAGRLVGLKPGHDWRIRPSALEAFLECGVNPGKNEQGNDGRVAGGIVAAKGGENNA
jgi:excisionase family DNA binding protein